MKGLATKRASLKQRAIEELKEFWITALYLMVFFGAFAFYRRMVLAQFGVAYLHYGVAIIEALVIAKVVLIGRALGLERHLNRGGPLILSVILKAAVFAFLAILFGVLEKIVEGLLHEENWSDMTRKLLAVSKHELLARMIILLISFLPFFAFWEIGRVLGRGKLIEMFFSRRRPPIPET